MHIFLTGPRDVGKTTIINRALTQLTEQQKENPLVVKGFRTFFGEDFAPGKNYALMAHAHPELADLEATVIAMRDRSGWSMDVYQEAFENEGVNILEYSMDADLILMDELGFMESTAFAFQKKVMSILDGDIPVIGVLKADTEFFSNSPFLNGIREHDKVDEIEVTHGNRDSLINEIVRRYNGIYMDRE